MAAIQTGIHFHFSVRHFFPLHNQLAITRYDTGSSRRKSPQKLRALLLGE